MFLFACLQKKAKLLEQKQPAISHKIRGSSQALRLQIDF